MKPNRLYGLVRNMVTSDYKQYGIYNTSQAFMFLIDNGAVVDKQTIQKLKEDIAKGKNITLDGDITVTGTSTFTGKPTINNDLRVNGNITASGDITPNVTS